MVEIVGALIGAVALVGGTLITARWTRSRPTDNPAPDPSLPASNTPPEGGINTAPRSSQQDDGGTNPPQPPRGARPGGVTVNGQFIETNNGTVSQNNYRDGKQ